MRKMTILFTLFFLRGLIVSAQSDWIPQSSNIDYDLSSVFFVGNTGYAIGGNGQTNANVVLKTIDSGVNWTILCRTETQFHSIFFTDANTGYTIDYYGILQTIDGGENWVRVLGNRQQTNYSSLHSLFFLDSNTGFCVGGFHEFALIMKTIDGGKTWTNQTNESITALTSVYFTDANTGFVVGYEGTIFKTEDGGTTWSKQVR